ncbi:hypothetical protein B4U80_03486 [Leptotrombidium deliense]|uniref:NWD1/2-like winged helix-turn-helix domain-containing protein n=1 Tax=Leptotrombidium deliense TaxID=299467 RepID=A0A443SEL7_9ACAR|nr:hypothetical protein B4U80_03486 [Leptotrombidium deliense]
MQSIGVSQSLDTDYAPLLQVQKLMQLSCGEKSVARRAPIVIVGGDGVGKSTLLSQVFTYCAEWIPEENEIVRIVRHVGQSPSSSYTSELLRSLCLHITLAFGFEMRSNINYELSSLSIWFQELLKLIETTTTNVHLVIVLDDLHHLKSPQTSTILGWMPWNLPPNVHLVCSVSENEESVLKLLKSRITSDNFIRLQLINNSNTILSMLQSKLRDRKRSLTSEQWNSVKQRIEQNDYNENPLSPLYAHLLATCVLNAWHSNFTCEYNQIPDKIETIVNNLLDELEQRFGQRIIAKICQFLTVIRYGFRELELQELIAGDDSLYSISAISVWLTIKDKLLPLFEEYYLLGRLYVKWSHSTIAECVRKRFSLYGKRDKEVHNELAAAFSVGFLEVNFSLHFLFYTCFSFSTVVNDI